MRRAKEVVHHLWSGSKFAQYCLIATIKEVSTALIIAHPAAILPSKQV
jgi:hypothetical protein